MSQEEKGRSVCLLCEGGYPYIQRGSVPSSARSPGSGKPGEMDSGPLAVDSLPFYVCAFLLKRERSFGFSNPNSFTNVPDLLMGYKLRISETKKWILPLTEIFRVSQK